MTPQDKVTIKKLPTGVPGLDEILGGGLPEFSFNIIAGAPGCGKTTLAHQFVFANATPEHPALYFTVLGEPALKMLRYQQQYSFFDASKLTSFHPLYQFEPGSRRTGIGGNTGSNNQGSRTGQTRHRGGGLLPNRGPQSPRERRRNSSFRSAPGPAADQLGGNHFSHRRVC